LSYLHVGGNMFLIQYLSNLPPKIITLIISAIPIIELRGSIPFAILKLNLAPFAAFSYGVAGSLIPVFPILFLLQFAEPILRKSSFFDQLLDKIYDRTRSKSKLIQDWELIGLILFVGIPFPGTGVWTGTLAAYLFGFSKIFSFFAALIGTMLAGVIMTFLSTLFQDNLSVILHLITKYALFIGLMFSLLMFLKKRK